MEPTIQNQIESRPDKCGGKPCIIGTRVRVWDIYVAYEKGGMSPDAIVSEYPTISLADVHAAMAYYWDNRESIDSEMTKSDEFVEQMKSMTGPGPLEKTLRRT